MPSLAKCFTVWYPMPLAPPVTIATFPSCLGKTRGRKRRKEKLVHSSTTINKLRGISRRCVLSKPLKQGQGTISEVNFCMASPVINCAMFPQYQQSMKE